MAPLREGNTVDGIYRVLRERIVDGTYGPGIRMSQAALAAELKVSRTPLREALHRLEADGLLVSKANSGMVVAPATPADAEQYYVIRLLVEPPTIASIIDELTEDDLQRMAADLEAMQRDHHRIRDFQEAHQRFHDTALQHYPQRLRELTQSLHLKILRHQRLYLSQPHAPEYFTDVDALFLEVLHARDDVLARQVMEFHLIDAALGLVLDSDPDHSFHDLRSAARGLGIDLAADGEGRIERPTTIRWHRRGAHHDLSLSTTNLEILSGTTPFPTKGDAA